MRMSGYRTYFRCDIVFIEQDEEKVVELQKGHGDWEQSMTWVSQSYCIHRLDNIGFNNTLYVWSTT